MRVNLARKGKKGSTNIDLSSLSLDSIKDFLSLGAGALNVKAVLNNYFLKLGVILIIYLVANSMVEAWKTEEVSKVRSRVESINKQKIEVDAKLAKIKGFEPIRQALEADEASLRTKIAILHALMEGRNMPARMLLEIAKIIPTRVWLTSIKISDLSVQFSGTGVSHEVISDFVNVLGSTNYFQDVSIKNITESMSAEGDQRLQKFELDAKRRQGT